MDFIITLSKYSRNEMEISELLIAVGNLLILFTIGLSSSVVNIESRPHNQRVLLSISNCYMVISFSKIKLNYYVHVY